MVDMPGDRQCEFFLLRYVPDVVKDEFVNIGVLLLESGSNGASDGYADVRFTNDWRRVRCLDPDADLELLKHLEDELKRELATVSNREKLRQRLQDSLSNVLQLSTVKACLTESPEQEMERLFRMYLERPRVAGRIGESSRQVIQKQMRRAFEGAGVWGLMSKRIPVARYTRAGDPLKIDCGYRPNGVLKLIQAVSLESDIDGAKVLAYSYPAIRTGIRRVENADVELTAIVEPDLDSGNEAIGFALAILQENEIKIGTSKDLPTVADTARRELRV